LLLYLLKSKKKDAYELMLAVSNATQVKDNVDGHFELTEEVLLLHR
jgi:hypothetical protein